MKSKLSLLSILLYISACQVNSERSEQVNATADSANGGEQFDASEKSYEFPYKSNFVAITQTSDNDTITFDRSDLPVDSFLSKVLTVGTFHEYEVWKSAENENWFGLFSRSLLTPI